MAEPAAVRKPTLSEEQVAGNRVQVAGGKVTVACKETNGVILRIFRFVKVKQPKPGGYDDVDKPVETSRITVHGPASRVGERRTVQIVGGYALTRNVDRDFWAKWMEQNKDSYLLENDLIAAFDKHESAVAWAKDHRAVTSGHEPLRPRGPGDKTGDPRLPAPGPNLRPITDHEEKDDEY